MAREPDTDGGGKWVPLTAWEIQYLYDALAEQRWEWWGDGGYGDGPNERLFQKLASYGGSDE